MGNPLYSNSVTLGQFTRVMTGSTIALASTSLLVAKAIIRNRTGNAAVTIGFVSTPLPISIAASAEYVLDISAFEGQRFDLSLVFVSGTDTQSIEVLYFA
jgi:hypothetical protein